MEVVVTITLGVQAGSLALIAFGLDSIVEIFASTVVIGNLHDDRHDPGDRRVHRALRLISGRVLDARSVPDGHESPRAHTSESARQLSPWRRLPGDHRLRDVRARRTQTHNDATGVGSEPLHAGAAMTFLDGCLSTSVLAALVLNAWLGWWWTDPAAALLVAAAAANEGVRHWHELATPRR